MPGEKELPLLDVDLEKIFACLTLDNVLKVFRALLTQQYKIVVTSSHISLITAAAEGLTSFLAPFEWQFTYVPVLPYSVFGILEAPMPVMVGMHSSRLRAEYFDNETLICDLDSNFIHEPNGEHKLIELPSPLEKMLKFELISKAKVNSVERLNPLTIQHVDSGVWVEI